MTFDAHHYVPVLKAKRGEKAALRLLDASICARVTPLLEIVERTDKTLDAHLNTAFKGLAEAASCFSRCFLDTRELALEGPAAAATVFARAVREGIVFAPVTGITRQSDVPAALAHRQDGIAIRLTRDEFEAGTLQQQVPAFLSLHGLRPEEVDLIADLGAVDELVAAGAGALATAFLADVPFPTRWKTLTLTSCGFPQSMSEVDRHSHLSVERIDWMAWRDDLYVKRSSIARLPAFGDGAIQHPRGVEHFDPVTMHMSAAIRYTSGDNWLLVKGESTKITPPSQQFPLLADHIYSGSLSSYYSGPSHCQGCAGIEAAASGAPGLGSAEAWRRLGTAHHITTVVGNLGGLVWP